MGERQKKEAGDGGGDFLQVILLSFSFMLLFTAFQTTGIIEETVLQSLRNESTSCQNGSGTIMSLGEGTCPQGSSQIVTFTGNGYVSLSMIYAVFSIASWLAPSVVAIIYPKWSMVITSMIYVGFIGSFLIPMTWLLYFLSIMLGAAAAVLWTAQGTFFTWISTPDTITRNSGVFYAINQCSLFFGNLFVFWQLRGKTMIDGNLRSSIFVPLTIVAICGVCLMCFLKNLKSAMREENLESVVKESSEISTPEESQFENGNVSLQPSSSPDSSIKPKMSMGSTALSAFIESLQLFGTSHMLLLSLCSVYSGLEYSFLSGVYSTAVGNTKRLGVDSKKFVGLVGILTGVGEVLGGSLFGLLGSRTTKKGRTPIVLLGAAVHFISFTAIYFNIPDEATLTETNDVSFFEMPNSTLALACSVLLGFGDACLQTQLIATFASVYQDKSSAAFAIFKFTQSAASAIAFYSSSYMGIFLQMIILFFSCVISATAFFIVEWKTGELSKHVKLEMMEDGRSESPMKEHTKSEVEIQVPISVSDSEIVC